MAIFFSFGQPKYKNLPKVETMGLYVYLCIFVYIFNTSDNLVQCCDVWGCCVAHVMFLVSKTNGKIKNHYLSHCSYT
jgi:hypothetical protein